MCGRYVEPNSAALERFWKIDRRNWIAFANPRYNIAPTMNVPIVWLAPDGATEMLGARWGLVPHWWSKGKMPLMTFNARSEEAHAKPMWRYSAKSRPCLMPARGWYEWNENEQTRNLSGRKTNQPYFHHSPDEFVIAIAGLWSTWERTESLPMLSCALMTKEAAPSVGHVHHRMPVILKPDYYSAWIDPQTPAEDVQAIITDARQDFEAYAVSTEVNSGRNDNPDLIERPSGASVL